MAFVAGFTSGVKSFVGGHVSQRSVVARTSSTVRMSASGMSKSVPFLKVPKNTVGLIGSVEFDPLGLSDTINIKFLQEAELKHGRICMLAALGFIVQELYTFGGPYFPKMAPVDAHAFYLKTGGMSQLLLFIAAFEAVSFYAIRQTMEGKREPGDFGFDPLGLGKNKAAFDRFRLSEIKNGRLAMIAVGGFIHQYWATKQTVIDQLTHFSPLADPIAGNVGVMDSLLRLRNF